MKARGGSGIVEKNKSRRGVEKSKERSFYVDEDNIGVQESKQDQELHQ